MKRRKTSLCKNCGCKVSGKKIQFKCDCNEKDCACDSIIEFEKEPKAIPFCCGTLMKRIK